MSNAPWFDVVAVRCPGPPTCGPHETLSGFRYDEAGKRYWATSLAAEYPETLCDAIARAFLDALKKEPDRGETLQHVFTTQGRTSRMDEATKRQKRELEHKACLRGLRQPHRARLQVLGWSKVGEALDKILGQVIDDNEETLGEWHGKWGTDGAGPAPPEIITNLRKMLMKHFSLEGGPPSEGLFGDLLVQP